MDHDEIQRGIVFLLADRRQDVDAPILEFERGTADIAVFVACLDAMQPLDRDLFHLVGDRVFAITGKAIDARSHDEVRAKLAALQYSS